MTSKTAHGAYRQAMAAMRRVRGHANDASKNIQQLNAAYPLPDDPALIQSLDELAEMFRSLEAALAEAKQKAHDIAAQYLETNRHRITKDVELTVGAPSMRLRKKSKED